jgi:hypothetical protein
LNINPLSFKNCLVVFVIVILLFYALFYHIFIMMIAEIKNETYNFLLRKNAMFRAIPKSAYVGDQVKIFGALTNRLPSNLPYFVDNLLEWNRPQAMPSRRRAIYASPTPELALENASAGGISRDEYLVCKVEVDPLDVKIAQLQVKDARYHADIRLLTKFINGLKMSEEDRLNSALIFAPGSSVAELMSCYGSAVGRQILEFAMTNITFWNQASSTPNDGEGELFFEMVEGKGYRLIAVGA